MQKPIHQKHGETGSVLFYILIAVALLAALSYAVASGNRSAGSGLDKERVDLAVSEIQDYAGVMVNAVAQLKLRGCADTHISFENNRVADYDNGNAPSDGTCDVFSVAGGGVQYKAPQAIWLDSAIPNTVDNHGEIIFTSSACIDQIGTGITDCDSDGGSTAELLMIIPYLKADICTEINRKNGVGVPGDAPPQDAGDSWNSTDVKFAGSYNGGTLIRDAGNLLDGRRSGCFQSDSYPDAGYHFYRVLIAR